MKAAVVERPGTLVVRQVKDPVMGDYDALCELLYGATCTGTDSHIIKGEFPFPIDLPAILGHESVGRVVKIGTKVRNYRIGDLVTRVGAPATKEVGIAWGGYAEYGLAQDHWAMAADGLPESAWAGSRVNQLVPSSVDPRVAPMFTTWRETLSYVTRMGMGRGSSVLVIGSGGNGLSFAAHAVNLGAARTWLVGSARSAGAARSIKVTGFKDHTSPACTEELARECPGGFDIIIDAVGKTGQADRYLPVLALGGRLGIYGLDDFAAVSVSPRLARGSFTLWSGGYDEAETHQRVSEFVLQGRLDAGVWYDCAKPWPLESINDAFRHLGDRRAVKVLISLKEGSASR